MKKHCPGLMVLVLNKKRQLRNLSFLVAPWTVREKNREGLASPGAKMN